MNIKKNKKLIFAGVLTLIGAFYILNLIVEVSVWYVKEFNPVPVHAMAGLEVERKSQEPTMKEWVLNEVKKAGLNTNEVDCLIQNESGWNQWAYNVNWSGKTTDIGLFQINSIHKGTISVEDRWNYKTATKWAINKRLHDGNWNAWYGYIYNCK